MDPSIHLPDITETHIAHAANPSPSLAPNHNHPPYAEMITAAITALKERDGSSRRAIAKYIEGTYTSLPPTHSALLTHHLKRLKNNGHLVMVKHSYKLPRSDSSTSAAITSTTPIAPLPKRGRGRPPTSKPTVAEPTTEPMLVALGLVDGPQLPPVSVIKRGPGRPPKVKTVSVGPKKVQRRPLKKPKLLSDVMGPGGGVKKSRGRPPKPKLVSDGLGPSGIKRGPGRPPKGQSIPVVIPYMSNVSGPRGRPKKDGSTRAKRPGRPPGRPRKMVNGVAGGVVMGSRRGRPSKVAGAKKPKKGTGRPVGRPRKKNALASMEAGVAPQWMMEYGEDIKNKLEYVQSRIKQAVGVIKPHLMNESAVGALQELEEISSMDFVSAPLQYVHVQVQVEEPPMPQPLFHEVPVQVPAVQNQAPMVHNQVPMVHNQVPMVHNQVPMVHSQEQQQPY